MEIYKILKPNTEIEAVIKFHESTVKHLFNRTLYTVSQSLEVIDKCREWGYATPCYGFSVQELVDCGIFVIKGR